MKSIYLIFLVILLFSPGTALAEETIAVGTGQLIRADNSKSEFKWIMTIGGNTIIEVLLNTKFNEADLGKLDNEIYDITGFCGYAGKDFISLEFCTLEKMPNDIKGLINIVKDKIKVLNKLSMFKNIVLIHMAEEWPAAPERKEKNEPISRGNNFC